MFRITKRSEMAGGTVILNEIEAPEIACKARPGQFVILKANETGERIPLTMADFCPERGTITVVYAVVGKSTAVFRDLRVGDCFQNVVGPLGQPTKLEKVGTVICIGGGTGVAVLYPIVRGLKALGNKVISITGARTESLLILEDEMRAASEQLLICTDDGSYCQRALVTDLLEDALKIEKPDMVVAIGPVPMMKRVCDVTREHSIKTIVSLNPIMIDGTGMCGVCRVEVGGEVKYACVDGPEFDGHLVDFDELSLRLRAYRSEEKQSMEKYNVLDLHRCKMEIQASTAR